MNKDYCLAGTKVIIRRLFKQDMDDIAGCYSSYKSLYHNPVTTDYIENIFLCGEIWGAFVENRIVACCYYFPLNSSFFTGSAFFSAITDFTPCCEKYYFMGYMGVNRENFSLTCSNTPNSLTENGIFQAFSNIAQMQAFRQGFRYILHASPVKLVPLSDTFFRCGYIMTALRGMENLVVHRIFVKAVYNEENIYETDQNSCPVKIPASETKKISALLENGYCGVDYSKNDDMLLMRRLITY